MINRKTRNLGVNANIGLDSTSAASSNNQFSNNIYVQTPYPTDVKTSKPSQFEIRDVEVELSDINRKVNDNQDEVRGLILETFANILLNQDKALIVNLISKRTIIVPMSDLKSGIQLMTNGSVEDVSCVFFAFFCSIF